MSTGDFESRLHQHLKNLVSARTDSYEKEFEKLQGALQDALADTVRKVLQESLPQLAEVARQKYLSVPDDPELSALAVEMCSAVEEARRERDEARKERDEALSAASQVKPVALGGLKSAIFEIQGYRTQAEVLSSLVEQSAAFVPRVALFIVKSGNAVGWLARGFNADGVGDEAVRGQTISLGADTTLRKALSRQTTCCEPPLEHIDNKQLYSIFGGTLPAIIAAVPLVVRGKSAAVLYADSTTSDIDVDALDILVNTAALTVELISVRPKGAEAPTRHQPASKPGVVAQPSPAPKPAPKVEPEPPKFEPPPPRFEPPSPAPSVEAAPPVPAQPPEPAFELKSAPSFVVTPEPPPAAPPAQFEFTPPPAEPTFELKSAPSFAVTPEPPPAAPPAQFEFTPPPAAPAETAPPASPPPQPAQPPAIDEDERKLHNDARRFARLLVSEIKLYNEQKVVEGRKNKDLYDRLKEDIDRSRQMYDKRVSPIVAAKFDYFYDELLNTLGESDPTKLGSDCPGPVLIPLQ